MIQLDTMHGRPLPGIERRQFTAIDVIFRCAVVGVRTPASAGTTTAFLDELLARMPVSVQEIQVDGGSEVMGAFEATCRAKGIALHVLPPRSPKLNRRVERRAMAPSASESWECYEGDLDCPLCIGPPAPGRPKTIPCDHTSTLPHSFLRCPERELPIDTLFDHCYNRYNVEPQVKR